MTDQAKLNIAILLAFYNGRRFFEQQFNSIYNQLDDNDILIIYDDFSADSEWLTKKYSGKEKVQVILGSHNIGPCAVFETLMKGRQKDILVFSDQDDIWMNNKLTLIRETFQNKDLLVISSNVTEIDEQNCVVVPSHGFNYNASTSILKNLIKPSFIGATMAIKNDSLKFLLPFPRYVYMHDMWVSVLAVISKRHIGIKEPLISYRRHSQVFTPHRSNLFRKVYWRICYLICLLIMWYRWKIL
jgi:glycosyltransferase involved in cell wall biosynthesis